MLDTVKSSLRSILLRTSAGYRYSLRRHGVKGPNGKPQVDWQNSSLKSETDWRRAHEQVSKLGLPPHLDLQKNWDSLAALDTILSSANKNEPILDAGTETYSVILPWLFLYGYRRLFGINLSFDHPFRRGPIRYEYGDITKTRFESEFFGAVACTSVIEHGVDLRAYFKEMSRVLKPAGILVTSTDYYETPIDCHGAESYGVPVHVFSREEILDAIEIAKSQGLHLTSSLDLACRDKPVYWERMNLHYTFLAFALRKSPN